MGLARATRNLARTARANPMWALLGVLLAPFRFARHIIGMGLFALALFLGLFALLLLSIWYFELDKNGAVAQLGLIGISGAVVLVTAWMFVLPLLRRFDYDDRADTHGSARFASAGEAQALNDDHGLLIGRDVKTGKPMRYAGPAHLLTIAPTRTGKGVGTIIPKAPSAKMRINVTTEFYEAHVADGDTPLDRTIADLMIAVAKRLPKAERDRVRAAL